MTPKLYIDVSEFRVAGLRIYTGVKKMSATKIDPKIADWISQHLKVTHNDLPFDYVRHWANRTSSDQEVYSYAVFGFVLSNQSFPQEDGKIEGSVLKEYLDEFEAKLTLRIYQEFLGVKTEGLPMFKIVGKEKMIENFRGKKCVGVVTKLRP